MITASNSPFVDYKHPTKCRNTKIILMKSTWTDRHCAKQMIKPVLRGLFGDNHYSL